MLCLVSYEAVVSYGFNQRQRLVAFEIIIQNRPNVHRSYKPGKDIALLLQVNSTPSDEPLQDKKNCIVVL